MRPLFARFLIKAAFEEPEDIQAMASLLIGGWGLGRRANLRVRYARGRMKRSVKTECRARIRKIAAVSVGG